MNKKQTSDLLALLQHYQQMAERAEKTASDINDAFEQGKQHGMQLAYMQAIAEIRKLNDTLPG
jgi:hypothetical protein